jgi:hypothetical protein
VGTVDGVDRGCADGERHMVTATFATVELYPGMRESSMAAQMRLQQSRLNQFGR